MEGLHRFQRKVPQARGRDDQGNTLCQEGRGKDQCMSSTLRMILFCLTPVFRESGAKSSCGPRFMKQTKDDILSRSMVSAQATVSICMLFLPPLVSESVLDISPLSALVSPWMENGDALTYVKKHDRLINYKNLVNPICL